MRTDIANFLASFRGWTCFHLSAGTIGSVFYLYLHRPGSQVEELMRHVSEGTGFRPWPGELILNAWCAAWRIDDLESMTVVATFEDDNSPEGPLLAGLRRLVGRTVTDIALEEPGLDCHITFDHRLRLSIFPVGVESYCDDNYCFGTNDRMFEVNERSTFSFGPYEDGEPEQETSRQ